jgi:hypothetical protein
MGGWFDPRERSDEDYQKDIERGKIDDFVRTDSGGVQTFQTTSDGATLVKDVEPADNDKGHQQTDFLIRDEEIVEIRVHDDDDNDD